MSEFIFNQIECSFCDTFNPHISDPTDSMESDDEVIEALDELCKALRGAA